MVLGCKNDTTSTQTDNDAPLLAMSDGPRGAIVETRSISLNNPYSSPLYIPVYKLLQGVWTVAHAGTVDPLRTLMMMAVVMLAVVRMVIVIAMVMVMMIMMEIVMVTVITEML